jgi:hypothetical protein
MSEDILNQPIVTVNVQVMQSTGMTCSITSGHSAGRRKVDANYMEGMIYCSTLFAIVTPVLQVVLCPDD